MSLKTHKCPINVRYRIWYFRPLFSPVSLNIFLATNPCKSRYKVFSVTSGNAFLRADKLILLFSFAQRTAFICRSFKPMRHGVNNCLLDGKLQNFKWPVKPGRSRFLKIRRYFYWQFSALAILRLTPASCQNPSGKTGCFQ